MPAPKSWILTPNQDSQPHASLSLGQILDDPYNPASALVAAHQIPPFPALTRDHTSKTDVALLSSSALTAAFDAWVHANGLPVGASASGQFDEKKQTEWRLKELESETFLPSLEYVRAVLGSGDVPAKTQWWKLRRRVYMVTGVRIARGAVLQRTEGESAGGGIGVEADASGKGVPVRAGVRAWAEAGREGWEVVGGMSDFVFAYRLNEITYRLWVSHRPIAFGETAAAGDGDEDGKGGDDGEKGGDDGGKEGDGGEKGGDDGEKGGDDGEKGGDDGEKGGDDGGKERDEDGKGGDDGGKGGDEDGKGGDGGEGERDPDAYEVQVQGLKKGYFEGLEGRPELVE